MRRQARGFGRAASATLAAAVLAASCVLRQGADPTRFYVLAASAADSAPPSGSLAIGLGPIVMPGYLQQPGLATRVATEVRYADVDRWAEPLPTLFARALGQDLAALVGARIVPYPWYRATPLDLVVRVDVTSFEVDAAGNARLDACWSIRGSRGSTVSHAIFVRRASRPSPESAREIRLVGVPEVERDVEDLGVRLLEHGGPPSRIAPGRREPRG